MKLILFILTMLMIGVGQQSFCQKSKMYQVTSPDGKILLKVTTGAALQWSINVNGEIILQPSALSLLLQGGEVLGKNPAVVSQNTIRINTSFAALNYKKASISDVYNEMTLNFKGDYGLIFRAYNDGVAYRFFTKRAGELTITNEQAEFNFTSDYNSFVPYVRDLRSKELYVQSFEALYEESKLSAIKKDTLAFLPLLVDIGKGKKIAVLEADLEDYPGMFIQGTSEGYGFKGMFAPYPLSEQPGGWQNLTSVVTSRAPHIARVQGSRSFPWRVAIITNSDAELANNDMVQKLAAPSRVKNTSWIKPGKVAWDWWNNWNISGVDFVAGVNTPTYKYYIDFAAANKIEYIIMDEGWSDAFDLFKLSPKVDLKEILNYAKQKEVQVILWAGWQAIDKQMQQAFPHYASMGVAGFKIDFMDRDDQKMVKSLYDIAAKAAEHQLVINYHGMYKPTGLQRTFPNILNFEGVKGMENVKWTPNDDVPRYDVTIPFIRMLAGPMDYTPGAMRNAQKGDFRPSNSMPMSQGTRCHQLAMYTIFEAPLQMLADNPTAYKKEQECTDFISKVPTVFDETTVLSGKVAEHVAIARKKNKDWYVGAMTNWTERDLELDFSFLGAGNFEAEIFCDGMNAGKDATDYRKEIVKVSASTKHKLHMVPGGGWAARIYPLK